jgi:hypothetical protein
MLGVMSAERPEVPAEIEDFLIGLGVRAGQIGGTVAGARRGGARGGARGAARMQTKVEQRTGEAPGTPDQVTARLIAAFPRATRLPAADHVRLAVPVGVTGLQQIVVDLEFGLAKEHADSVRMPVTLRGFGKEGLISRKPTRTVTDQAWSVVISEGSYRG